MQTILFIFSLAFLPVSLAQEFVITSIVRELTMKAGEQAFKDVYINAGSSNGLKSGAYLEAMRRLPMFDNINNKVVGNTPVKIARLKLIYVDRNFSVARLIKMYDKETTPLSGYESVMVGDFIEVSKNQRQ